MCKNEAGDVGETHEVSCCVVLYHERPMVDYSSSAQSFNNERLILAAAIVLNGHLYNALLDEEHLIGFFSSFADKLSFVIGYALHAVDQLLFRRQRKGLQPVDLFHLNHDERSKLVLIFEYLLFEYTGHGCKGLC